MGRLANKYDAVIIGAGISGLVCGCYLAKAGIKTLIVEKNAKPGGYCMSFTRNGFTFDACAHSLGGLRKNGNVARILKELNIDTRIEIMRYNPSNVIVTPDYKVSFWNNLNMTVKEFQKIFPKEKENIQRFFNYLSNSNGSSSVNLINKTFEDLLREYFRDYKLKAILSLPVLGNTALPAPLISAFTAVKLYQEFIFDGGYYPKNCIQDFPDIFAMRFEELGGTLLLSQTVKKIQIKNNRADAVVLERGDTIVAKYVISNCDARQTLLNLNTDDINKQMLENMTVTDSMFIAYLGVDNNLATNLSALDTSIWFTPHYDIERLYQDAKKRSEENISWYFIHILPSKKSLSIFINAAFESKNHWKVNKAKILEAVIKKAENIIPGLSKHIVLKDAATPSTLYEWTLNYRGAAYGWASTPSQLALPQFSQKTFLDNLYLTGHWTTLAQGIPGVAYIGKDTAKIILRREKKYA